jgi:mRNA-degrading endonuclease RelE of RelBE toxin-antitoxin system
MEVTFGYTTEFKRQIKRLRKKYASLQSDFDELLAELSENPFAGVDLGDGVRKVRMAIKSKGKGESGGARVITYNIDEKAEVPHIDFLTIYDKSEIDNVSDSYIRSLLNFTS